MDRIHRDHVLMLYQRLLEAWNRASADDFAAPFAEDGNVVGFDGSIMNGRAEIESALRGVFGHHRTAGYVARVREIRELAPGIVLVRSTVGMIPPGKSELNPAVNAIQSLVVVGHGADARIALLHNTPAAFHGRPELAEQLTQELTEVLRTGQMVSGG